MSLELNNLDLDNALYIGTAALVCYDHILTIPEELDILWRSKKLSGAAWLLLANRYFLLCKIASQIALTIKPDLICQPWFLFTSNLTANLILNLVALIFSALRTYALGSSARKIAIIVLLLGLIPIVMSSFGSAYITTHMFNCVVRLYPDVVTIGEDGGSVSYTVESNIDIFPFSGPCITMLIDLAIAITTWTKTFKNSREARRLGIRSSLVWIMLRDGSLYFFVLTLLNMIQILVAVVQAGSNKLFLELYPSGGYVGLLQPVLISRFILNLKHGANGGTVAGSTVGYDHTDVLFAPESSAPANTGVGSVLLDGMGAPLSHGFEDEDEVSSVDAESTY